MALSPWPAPAAEAEAIDKLGMTLKWFTEVPGSASERARVAAIGKASAALVENFAPGAPQEIKDEAVVRSAGWLSQIPKGILSEAITVPAILGRTGNKAAREKKITYASSAGALRSSGGMALLSPWKKRRAGIIK